MANAESMRQAQRENERREEEKQSYILPRMRYLMSSLEINEKLATYLAEREWYQAQSLNDLHRQVDPYTMLIG